jgi:DNA-directed RNA polymerase specialized sigma24 family protein
MPARENTRSIEIPESTDLRRRHHRDLVQRLLDRATCLPAPDLALLRAAYDDGRSAVEIAAMLGTEPRAIRRRLRRLAQRVLSEEFLFVLRHRDSWDSARRNIATACLLHGRSIRQTARELGLSLYTVRRHYLAILALFEAAAGRPARGPVLTRLG